MNALVAWIAIILIRTVLILPTKYLNHLALRYITIQTSSIKAPRIMLKKSTRIVFFPFLSCSFGLIIFIYQHIFKKEIQFDQMEGNEQRKLYSTLKRGSQLHNKDKIFNVRKLPYKQFDNQKFLKMNCSPFGKKEPFNEHQMNSNNAKNMEYHYQLAIMTSPAYKELHRKYKEMKDQNRKEKDMKMKILHEKEEELNKYINERRRLEQQRQRLLAKRQQLKQYIQHIRCQRFAMEQQRSEEYRIMNMEYLKDMMIGMHYQGGVDIDPDNMTYEQLLQLQEKMGKVSKGISEDQYKELPRVCATKQHEAELCSICYYNVKEAEDINCLPCKHIFHCECIKEWLLKEKVCPLCKQEISVKNEEKQGGAV